MSTRGRRIGIQVAFVAAVIAVAGLLLRGGIWQGVGTRHYAANGVEFDYPSGWTIHDKIPGTTGLGSEFLILGTLPWGPCDDYDINCHYQQKLDPGQVTIGFGWLAVSGTDLCELGSTSSDLAGRGPGDPPATRTLLRLAGEGQPGVNGGPPGDLYVFLKVKEHAFFERHEADLHCTIPINMAQAALGCEIEVPTLEQSTKLKIPEGTQNGAQFKLRHKGVAVLNSSSRGDLYVHISVRTPTRLTREQRKMLEQLRETLPVDNRPAEKGLFEKVKDLFM